MGFPKVNIRCGNHFGWPERPGEGQGTYSDYPNIRKGALSIGRVILNSQRACTAFLSVNISCRNLSDVPERPGKVGDSYIDYINIRGGDPRLN
jgi:hypothetical protein